MISDYLKKIEVDCTRYDFLIQISDKWMGEIVLNEIHDKKAEFRIALFHSSYCNQGIGQKAMRLLFDFAFDTLGFEEIELEVIAINTRAKHVYEKFGFTIVKRLEKEYYYLGEDFDAFVMKLTKEKYKKVSDIG